MSDKITKSPQIRFAGFTDPWEQRKLGEIVERVTRKNKNLESTLPLTISAQYGLIDQNDFFDKQVASRDVSGYYLLYNGEFAYNKSYSNGYPWGAIKRLDYYDKGVLSTLYITFRPVHVNSDFLVSYYDTSYWYKEVSKHAAEGARNHGLLNIAASDFFQTELPIPKDKEEQSKIGAFFKQLDNLIALHQRKYDKLVIVKKSMQEKMFPKDGANVPEIRFAGFTDAWEQRKFQDFISKAGKKNTMGENYTAYSVSNKLGLVSQTEQFDGSRLDDLDKTSYKLVNPNEFAYNPARVNVGSIAFNNLDKTVIVSSLYVVLKMSEVLDNEFILQFIKSKFFIDEVRRNTEGSVREYLFFENFKNIKFPYTSNKDEQAKIGNFFKQLDDTIALHQRELNSLKSLKKSLLQQMFI